MPGKQQFGDRLLRLREQSKLSQQSVGDLIDVSRSAVNGYEKGKSYPVADKLLILARHFGVSVDYLLTGETQKPMPGEGIGINISDVSESQKAQENPRRGAPATHEGITVPTPRVGRIQPAKELVGTDLIKQVSSNARDIELIQQTLEVVVAELRQLANSREQ